MSGTESKKKKKRASAICQSIMMTTFACAQVQNVISFGVATAESKTKSRRRTGIIDNVSNI